MSFGFNHLYQNTYSVWGTKGIVTTNRAFAIPPTLVPQVVLVTNNGKEEQREVVDVSAANQFALSFDFFFKVIAENNTERFNDLYQRILAQARVLEAMRTSAKEGGRVAL